MGPPKSLGAYAAISWIVFCFASPLSPFRYRVVEAASTDEAIVILQKTNIPVDVVLSEIGIPGSINGFGFAQWARSVRPELKILLAGTPERTVQNGG
jgi:response regulator RpfG family c-di-GMP phosphodiesterase